MYNKVTINGINIEEYKKELEEISEGKNINDFKSEIFKEIKNMKCNINIGSSDNSKEIFLYDMYVLKLIAIINEDINAFEGYKNAIDFANKKNIDIKDIYNQKEFEEIEEIHIIKERKKILKKINKIEFKDGAYKIYGNISNEEILILIGEGYKKSDSLEKGNQAQVNNLKEIKTKKIDLNEDNKKKLIVRVQNKFENDEEIENNNKVLTQLKEIKKGSTFPIFSFINEKNEKIGIYKKREKGDVKNFIEDSENTEKLLLTRFIRRILESVENIHIAGGIHRDIKLDNICLNEKNDPKIIDFGLASLISNTENLERDGTLMYLAPELFEDPPTISQKNDIYSSGITILEMLLKKYKYSFFSFLEKKAKNKLYTTSQFVNYIYYHDIVNLITKDDLDLSVFNIADNDELKEKLINTIKHMIQRDPEDRFDIFQLKKEFKKIEDFIVENNLEQENKKNLDIDKFKKHLKKLMNRPVEEEKIGIIYEKDKNSLEELDFMFKDILIEKQSQNVKECIEYLYNCIDEENNIILPGEEFYCLLGENFKENNKGKLSVMVELAKLKELNLAVNIEKLEKKIKENNEKLVKENQKMKEKLEEVKDLSLNIKKITIENKDNIGNLKQLDQYIFEKIEEINSIFEKLEKTGEHKI